MRNEYDFSKSVPNPYLQDLENQVTLKLEEETINYFKQLSKEHGIPYKHLIGLYLKDCMRSQRKLSLEWLDAQ
ncbi:MAG: antitoxin [Cyanobacteria bacterium P01_A01_bin.15]